MKNRIGLGVAAAVFCSCMGDQGTGTEQGAEREGVTIPVTWTENLPAGTPHPERVAAKASAMPYQYLWPVGVISHEHDCASADVKSVIYMDDSNNNNNSTISWPGSSSYTPFGVSDGDSHNTRFQFCRVDGADLTNFRRTAGSETGSSDYAVLSLADQCPPGSLRFSRYIDNENTSNNNYSTGDIYPNVVNNNTRLYLCYFPEVYPGGMDHFPSTQYQPGSSFHYAIFGSYVVFAPANALNGPSNWPDAEPFATGKKGHVYSDDSNTNNNNSWTFIGSGWTADYQTRAKNIISSQNNTHFRIALTNQPI